MHLRSSKHNIEVTSYDVDFLETLIYEWIRRSMFFTNFRLSSTLLKAIAFKFKSILNLESFTPTDEWIEKFRITYNLKEVDTSQLDDIGCKIGKSVGPADIFNDLQPQWVALDPKSINETFDATKLSTSIYKPAVDVKAATPVEKIIKRTEVINKTMTKDSKSIKGTDKLIMDSKTTLAASQKQPTTLAKKTPILTRSSTKIPTISAQKTPILSAPLQKISETMKKDPKLIKGYDKTFVLTSGDDVRKAAPNEDIIKATAVIKTTAIKKGAHGSISENEEKKNECMKEDVSKDKSKDNIPQSYSYESDSSLDKFDTNEEQIMDIEDELPVCTIFGRKTVQNVANIVSDNKSKNETFQPMIVCTDPKNPNHNTITLTEKNQTFTSIVKEVEKPKDVIDLKQLETDANTSSPGEFIDQYIKVLSRVPDDKVTYSSNKLFRPLPLKARRTKCKIVKPDLDSSDSKPIDLEDSGSVAENSKPIESEDSASVAKKPVEKNKRKRKYIQTLAAESTKDTNAPTKTKAVDQTPTTGLPILNSPVKSQPNIQTTTTESPKLLIPQPQPVESVPTEQTITSNNTPASPIPYSPQLQVQFLPNNQTEISNEMALQTQQLLWNPSVFPINNTTPNFAGDTILETQPGGIFYTIQMPPSDQNLPLTMPYISSIPTNFQTQAMAMPIVYQLNSPIQFQTTGSEISPTFLNLQQSPLIQQTPFVQTIDTLQQTLPTTNFPNCTQNQFIPTITTQSQQSLFTNIPTTPIKSILETISSNSNITIKPIETVPEKNIPPKTQKTAHITITPMVTNSTTTSYTKRITPIPVERLLTKNHTTPNTGRLQNTPPLQTSTISASQKLATIPVQKTPILSGPSTKIPTIPVNKTPLISTPTQKIPTISAQKTPNFSAPSHKISTNAAQKTPILSAPSTNIPLTIAQKTSIPSRSSPKPIPSPPRTLNSTTNSNATNTMPVRCDSLTRKNQGTRFAKREPLKTKEEAIKYIKLMEDFAMLNEDFRLIGFLERLQKQV